MKKLPAHSIFHGHKSENGDEFEAKASYLSPILAKMDRTRKPITSSFVVQFLVKATNAVPKQDNPITQPPDQWRLHFNHWTKNMGVILLSISAFSFNKHLKTRRRELWILLLSGQKLISKKVDKNLRQFNSIISAGPGWKSWQLKTSGPLCGSGYYMHGQKREALQPYPLIDKFPLQKKLQILACVFY